MIINFSGNLQPIASGGTGADTAEGARENLSVFSRTETEEIIGTRFAEATLTVEEIREICK